MKYCPDNPAVLFPWQGNHQIFFDKPFFTQSSSLSDSNLAARSSTDNYTTTKKAMLMLEKAAIDLQAQPTETEGSAK
jgi:hypothetical protein